MLEYKKKWNYITEHGTTTGRVSKVGEISVLKDFAEKLKFHDLSKLCDLLFAKGSAIDGIWWSWLAHHESEWLGSEAGRGGSEHLRIVALNKENERVTDAF